MRYILATLLMLIVGVVFGADDALKHRVPDGFIIERVASEPDIVFPMFAAFDDRGRLFVAESSGLDLYAELKAQTRKCRIRLLEDRDERGRFRKSSVFADKLVFPMGLAWRDGRLYVADPPDLVTLEDTDGDGKADRRTVILTDFGHVDNGSLHGLTFGPDGLLYMTMGRPDGYKIKRRDGAVIEGKTGALLRCRPDGADPEVLCRGFENLVEIIFTPQADIIGTDNWFQLPTGGIRDALVHLVPGGLYPLHGDQGTPQPVSGEVLPAISLFPAVALSGLEIYRGQAFPREMQGSLFSAQHNSRKVGRHVLVPHGSTFRTQDFDFVTSDDPDFHPADVLEDADGSLLVLDTGSWYVHHCPTGQIRKTKATGGIYRVRKLGAPAVDDPWGLAIAWPKSTPQQLAGLLSDPRPVVRDRAQRTLSVRGKEAITALAAVLPAKDAPVIARQHAIWALAGIADDAALPPLRDAVSQKPEIAIPAMRALALRRDARSADRLGELLDDRHPASPAVPLAAAEALARCGDGKSLPILWRALERDPDRFLEHALIHALYHLANTASLEKALSAPYSRVQKAALVLLDQPPRPRDQLKPEQVVARFRSTDAELRLTARRILQKHPEWAEFGLGLIRGWLEKPQLPGDEEAALRELLLTFQGDKAVQDMLATVIVAKDDKYAVERRLLGLETMATSNLPNLPATWADGLAHALHSPVAKVRLQAARTAGVLQIAALDDALVKLSTDKSEQVELRLEALRAVVLRRPQLSPPAFALILSQLHEDASPLSKLTAIEVAGRSHLDDTQVLELVKAIRGDALVSPSVVLPALQRARDDQAAGAVIDYLAESIKGGWKPSETELDRTIRALPTSAQKKSQQLHDLLRQSAERQRARLSEFEPLLSDGNAERGRAVFFGKKVACATCHRVAAEGGTIGPDLTKVGAIRAGRDLLESVVVPSSTIAQGFDPYTIVTADGRVINGIIARQAGEFLVVRDASGGELQLRKDKVQEMRRSATSIMPEGLERAISRDELRDLLAFLQSLR